MHELFSIIETNIFDQHNTTFNARDLHELLEKDKQALPYLFGCDRRVDPMTRTLSDPAAMRELLFSYTEKVLTHEEEIKALTSKAEVLGHIAKTDGLSCITDAAKTLQVRPKDLFQWLSENKWIYRSLSSKSWVAYQERVQEGFLHNRVTTVSVNDEIKRVTEQVLVTPIGLVELAEVFSMVDQAA